MIYFFFIYFLKQTLNAFRSFFSFGEDAGMADEVNTKH